eukprot:scaffold1959_cov243-Pinguiococcus_pyrenoidosus.AAC.13
MIGLARARRVVPTACPDDEALSARYFFPSSLLGRLSRTLASGTLSKRQRSHVGGAWKETPAAFLQAPSRCRKDRTWRTLNATVCDASNRLRASYPQGASLALPGIWQWQLTFLALFPTFQQRHLRRGFLRALQRPFRTETPSNASADASGFPPQLFAVSNLRGSGDSAWSQCNPALQSWRRAPETSRGRAGAGRLPAARKKPRGREGNADREPRQPPGFPWTSSSSARRPLWRLVWCLHLEPRRCCGGRSA